MGETLSRRQLSNGIGRRQPGYPRAEPPAFIADAGFCRALATIRSTLAISTVPGGVFLVGCPGDAASLHVAHLPIEHAWGLAADSQRLSVATHREVIVFANSPLLAAEHPDYPGYFDA